MHLDQPPEARPMGDAGVQSGGADASMGEEGDDRWLRWGLKCTQLRGCRLVRFPMGDALDIKVAITAGSFRAWWAQETRDVVRYISHAGVSPCCGGRGSSDRL